MRRNFNKNTERIEFHYFSFYNIALFIFFYIALDVGFSYWLAEYFSSELNAGMKISSAGVGIFLLGLMAGRLATSRLLGTVKSRKILLSGLASALVSLLVFLLARPVSVKLAMVFFYGLGLAPVAGITIAEAVFILLLAVGVAAVEVVAEFRARPEGFVEYVDVAL